MYRYTKLRTDTDTTYFNSLHYIDGFGCYMGSGEHDRKRVAS